LFFKSLHNLASVYLAELCIAQRSGHLRRGSSICYCSPNTQEQEILFIWTDDVGQIGLLYCVVIFLYLIPLFFLYYVKHFGQPMVVFKCA